MLTKFLKNEDGATAIEYGLIAAGIGLVLAAAAPLVGGEIRNMFNDIVTALQQRPS
ncbi:MAG: Flp family type IVb pilin [Hyphomicrobiales bacterium]